jgi:hypothetical protein
VTGAGADRGMHQLVRQDVEDTRALGKLWRNEKLGMAVARRFG